MQRKTTASNSLPDDWEALGRLMALRLLVEREEDPMVRPTSVVVLPYPLLCGFFIPIVQQVC